MKLMMLEAMSEGLPPEALRNFLESEGFGPDDFDKEFFNKYENFYQHINHDHEQQLREEQEEERREMAKVLGKFCAFYFSDNHSIFMSILILYRYQYQRGGTRC